MKFWNSFNCANLLQLLSYRHQGFTGEYATRKIPTASRVALASEDEQHFRCRSSVRLRSSSQISSKTEIARSLLKWSIFQIITSDDIDHIIYFQAFSRLLAQTVSLFIKKKIDIEC